jgi:hypothetical protein
MGEGSGRVAKVVKAYPEAHKVDIIMCSDGRRMPMVDVAAHAMSTNSGLADLHIPTPPATPYDIQNTGVRDVLAFVQFFDNIPVVMGFKTPEVGQMTFVDPGRRIDRHGSDVYSTIRDNGDFEMAWPNGTYLRVASTPAHEDLTGQDFDGQWKIARNTGAALYVKLQSGAFSVEIDPAGNITSASPSWEHTGDIMITGSLSTTGNATVGTGASGSFTTPTGQTVMVQNGIVTNIY